MNKFFTWVNKHILDLFLVFLIVLNVAPILAPIFLHLGANAPAKAIYTVYSFFCHQQHWKSLHLFDHQCAWCTRDMFIWGSMLLVLILVRRKTIQPLTFYSLVLYSIPMAMDGGLQTLGAITGFASGSSFYTSNNFFRMLTGTLFGTAMGLFMFPRMKEISQEDLNNNAKDSKQPEK